MSHHNLVYLSTRIGKCFVEALDHMIEKNLITENQKKKFLLSFDEAMSNNIAATAKANLVLKIGKFELFRYLGNVWILAFGNVTIEELNKEGTAFASRLIIIARGVDPEE